MPRADDFTQERAGARRSIALVTASIDGASDDEWREVLYPLIAETWADGPVACGCAILALCTMVDGMLTAAHGESKDERLAGLRDLAAKLAIAGFTDPPAGP